MARHNWGKVILRQIEEQGMSVSEVAAGAGIDRKTLRGIIGGRQQPNIKTLEAYSMSLI